MESQNQNGEQSANVTLNQSIPLFLLKTYQILENPAYADIICWTKTGEGFIVKKVKEFAEKILPLHFRHSNYTSFVRQLNMYDFHKTRQENQENAFKNFMFKRGQRHLLKDIMRKDYKKNKESRVQLQVDKNQEENCTDKKYDNEVKYAKDFYSKWVPTLEACDQQISNNINKIASIDTISQKIEKLMPMIDILMEAKKTNKNSMMKVNEFCQNWGSFVCKRGLSLKMSQENDHEVKGGDPTFTTQKQLPYPAL